jgi:hypothetical protein
MPYNQYFLPLCHVRRNCIFYGFIRVITFEKNWSKRALLQGKIMKTVIIKKSWRKYTYIYIYMCVCVLDVYFTKYGFLFLLLRLIINIYDIVFVCNTYSLITHWSWNSSLAGTVEYITFRLAIPASSGKELNNHLPHSFSLKAGCVCWTILASSHLPFNLFLSQVSSCWIGPHYIICLSIGADMETSKGCQPMFTLVACPQWHRVPGYRIAMPYIPYYLDCNTYIDFTEKSLGKISCCTFRLKDSH